MRRGLNGRAEGNSGFAFRFHSARMHSCYLCLGGGGKCLYLITIYKAELMKKNVKIGTSSPAWVWNFGKKKTILVRPLCEVGSTVTFSLLLLQAEPENRSRDFYDILPATMWKEYFSSIRLFSVISWAPTVCHMLLTLRGINGKEPFLESLRMRKLDLAQSGKVRFELTSRLQI